MTLIMFILLFLWQIQWVWYLHQYYLDWWTALFIIIINSIWNWLKMWHLYTSEMKLTRVLSKVLWVYQWNHNIFYTQVFCIVCFQQAATRCDVTHWFGKSRIRHCLNNVLYQESMQLILNQPHNVPVNHFYDMIWTYFQLDHIYGPYL